MSGWMKFDIDRWPEVLDKYERPVPAWVAEHDLRWLDNEVRMGRLARLPGRDSLMKRWGCTAYVAQAALRNVIRSSSGDHQEIIRSSSGNHQFGDITSCDIEQKSSGDHQEIIRSSSGDHQEIISDPLIVVDSASVLELPKKEEVRNKKEEKKDNIHIDELNEKWLSLFGKLRAPTKEGIEKTLKAIGKEKTSLLIDWLASNHPRARLLRGETGEEVRLHSATPWRPSHRTEYLSFAEEESELPTLFRLTAKASPTERAERVAALIIALPDPHSSSFVQEVEKLPNWKVYAELAGGSIGALREQLKHPFRKKEAINKLIAVV